MTFPANAPSPNRDVSIAPSEEPPNGHPRRKLAPIVPPSRKEALLGRLWAAAESQVSKIEQRSRDLPGGGNLEHEAKALAVLCRILRELPTDDEIARTKARAEPEIDDGMRDADEFRDELAQHLARIAQERDNAGGVEAGEPEAAPGMAD